MFSIQILAAIKKINPKKGDQIEIRSSWRLLKNHLQTSQHMVSDGKMINTTHKGLYYY